MRLKYDSELAVLIHGFHRLQKSFNFCRVMCVVVNINDAVTFHYKFKSALHTGERLQGFFYGRNVHSAMTGRHGGCNCIFDIVKTGDTEPYMFNLAKSMQVEFKKSALGGNVAGKKLSPAHAVNIFSNVVYIICKKFRYGLMDDQMTTGINLFDEISERSDKAFMISVYIKMISIGRSYHCYLWKQP